MHYGIAAALAVASTMALPAPADAPQSPTEADRLAIQSYRLTMSKLEQLSRAYIALARVAQSDPQMQALRKVRAELDALHAKQELTDADERRIEQLEAEIAEVEERTDGVLDMGETQSIAEAARRLDAHPQFAAAVKGAGLTTREFATLQMALFQAMFARGFLKAGTITEVPKDVNPDNVKFLQDHEAEIQKMARQWEAAGVRTK
jgi:phage gp16-like protein